MGDLPVSSRPRLEQVKRSAQDFRSIFLSKTNHLRLHLETLGFLV
jgi:hypothetical protein